VLILILILLLTYFLICPYLKNRGSQVVSGGK